MKISVWRRVLVGCAVLACLGTGAAGAAAAPGDDPVAADLMKDWSAQKTRILDLADAMPAEKYDFKATEPQRTFGEQLHHLAEAHVRMLQALDPEGTTPVPEIAKGYDKATVMRVVRDAYDYGEAVLRAQGAVAERAGQATRARVVWSAMMNAMNHYGQCVVYLRLNGIVPPASRR